jgi:hypothetical protein
MDPKLLRCPTDESHVSFTNGNPFTMGNTMGGTSGSVNSFTQDGKWRCTTCYAVAERVPSEAERVMGSVVLRAVLVKRTCLTEYVPVKYDEIRSIMSLLPRDVLERVQAAALNPHPEA